MILQTNGQEWVLNQTTTRGDSNKGLTGAGKCRDREIQQGIPEFRTQMSDGTTGNSE